MLRSISVNIRRFRSLCFCDMPGIKDECMGCGVPVPPVQRAADEQLALFAEHVKCSKYYMKSKALNPIIYATERWLN